ncbi:MAG: FecR domain-containing protein [Sandaracinaceae bacterium]|nr:FecR domain-containing protein [Sandaracinaceae bacterium]MBK8590273.1 FecR domain-containing protein [Sandaracinaceae bacterium]MBP7683340.1 FecR domain-containing protein [Deltaproteobacteria bacterium]
MNDQRIERARDALESGVDERKVQSLWRRIGGARRSRPRRERPALARGLSLAAAALVVLGTLGGAGWALTRSMSGPLRLADGSPMPSTLEATHAQTFQFDDGSELELAAGSRVDLLDTTRENVRLALRGGHVVFRVRPHGPRHWEVECGPLSIEVVGTVFSVVRDAERVQVSVERGAVLVRGARVPDHVQRLGAGQSLAVAPDVEVPVERADEVEAPEPVAAPEVPPASNTPRGARAEGWREHLAAGRYLEAYEALGSEGIARETERAQRVEDLMRLADLARLSGHPDDALLPLERIVERHPHSRSAAIAAYTLGRLRLERLGDPGGAVVVFERSLAMGLPAALQEPARARLVRALRADGDPRMEDAGRRYLELYPDGASAGVIRRWIE